MKLPGSVAGFPVRFVLSAAISRSILQNGWDDPGQSPVPWTTRDPHFNPTGRSQPMKVKTDVKAGGGPFVDGNG